MSAEQIPSGDDTLRSGHDCSRPGNFSGWRPGIRYGSSHPRRRTRRDRRGVFRRPCGPRSSRDSRTSAKSVGPTHCAVGPSDHEVGVPLGPGALVDHRTVLLGRLELQVGLVSRIALSSLFPEREHDDRRVILRRAVHIHHPVRISPLPRRIVGGRTAFLERKAAQVRIDIGTVADVDSVTVGQFVKTVALRIERDTHAVDPLLPEANEIAHVACSSDGHS